MFNWTKYLLTVSCAFLLAYCSNNGGTMVHTDNHIESAFKNQIYKIFPAFKDGEFWLEMDDFNLLKASVAGDKINSKKYSISGLDFESSYILMPQHEEKTLIVKYGRGLSKVDLESKKVLKEYLADMDFSSGTDTWLVTDKNNKNLRCYFERFLPNAGGESELTQLSHYFS